MSDEIIKILDDLAKRFGIAIDWSSENVVPYLKELFGKFINYELYTSVAWILLGIIAIILGIFLIKNGTKLDDVDGIFFMIGFGILISSIGIVITFVQIYDIIACMTFPEKILFDTIKSYLENIN